MTQTTAAQRAELAGVLAQLRTGATWWGSADGARRRLLELVPALLADAAVLAEREADDAADDPPIVTPAVPSREVTVRIVGRERVVSAKYAEGRDDGR